MISVFVTYMCFSSIVNDHPQVDQLTYMGGQFIQVIGPIIGLMAYTESFDNTFQTVKALKKKLNELLINTRDKTERQILKGQLKKVEMVEPMSACGYFTIDKSTLTSMLSVR